MLLRGTEIYMFQNSSTQDSPKFSQAKDSETIFKCLDVRTCQNLLKANLKILFYWSDLLGMTNQDMNWHL